MSSSTSSISTSAPTLSLAQRVSAYEEWTRRREGPPPILPPICATKAISAKHASGKYSDAFGDDKVSVACMATLPYVARRSTDNPDVYTCGLPSGEKLRKRDQSPEVKKAKQAATRLETAKLAGDTEAAKTALTELRQIVERVLTRCLRM